MSILTLRWSCFGATVALTLLAGATFDLLSLGVAQSRSGARNSQPGQELATPDVFRQPTVEERRKAVGDLGGIPEPLRGYFQPTEDNQPIPDPQPGDWLQEHPEPHQSFEQYRREKPNRSGPKRNVIYLLPLDQFDEYAPPMDELRAFLQAFYGVATQVLPRHQFPERRITERVNSTTQRRQWLTTDVLRELERLLPADAYCLLAVTMTDLYPNPNWNFVFGQATFKQRVGVYSFSRFDPAFWGEERTPEERLKMIRRTCQLIAHETGHMFGIRHCVYYQCVMNGSNHQGESDTQPLRLCPVCLRKLHWAVQFDPGERKEHVAEVLARIGISDRPISFRE